MIFCANNQYGNEKKSLKRIFVRPILEESLSLVKEESLPRSLVLLALFFAALAPRAAVNVLRDQRVVSLQDIALLETTATDRVAALVTGTPGPGFAPYRGGTLPQNAAEGRRMYVARGTFALDPSLAAVDLGMGLGPIDYPCDVYLNGAKIFAIGRHLDGYQSIDYAPTAVAFPNRLLRYGAETNDLALVFYPRYATE